MTEEHRGLLLITYIPVLSSFNLVLLQLKGINVSAFIQFRNQSRIIIKTIKIKTDINSSALKTDGTSSKAPPSTQLCQFSSQHKAARCDVGDSPTLFLYSDNYRTNPRTMWQKFNLQYSSLLNKLQLHVYNVWKVEFNELWGGLLICFITI